ncbi:precorrin-4/cobalt-precorrin-4 C11-methyltransferase [Desulfuromusa kysingii]|uniref:Precorrin-4/cobalt-precorrin-4 C11-methyltransferase n=1 Tax=Desulfuromusa kysingii TaxID=37625 RepID=A0A1H4AHU0_9BACT|nr:precorrin-4 C(11)-methyltransferase [Desulfuromusa kysingii]SEA35496.1 precorrin-4/cobalt-precorrin-4 C11-methyltransferase [Desulfuromusa kysingii]
MKVYFVGAGPGNPELMTLLGHRLLSQCKICIYAGSLIPPEVIAVAPDDAELYDSAKMTLEEMETVFRKAQQEDVDLVRLHTGDPSIYGAIREQMNSLDRMQIEYAVVPGISSFQAAAATLKTELTAPEVTQTVILSRTSGRTPMPEKEDLQQLAKMRSTLCLFLSVHKIAEVAQELGRWYGDDCPIAVVFHASWPDEKVIRGTLQDIAAKVANEGIKKTAMIIVGQALSRDIPVSKLYHHAFTHGYRQGSAE